MKLSLRLPTIVYPLAAALIVAPGATVAHSQTTLAWPDSRIDVGTYRSLESCLAAIHRVTDSVRVRSEVAEDTIARPMLGDTMPVAAEVRTTAQRCLARYSAGQISLREAFLAQQLYLVAGQDDNADIVIQQRLRSVPSKDTMSRAVVLDSIVTGYLNAQPARLMAAHSYLEQLERIRNLLPIERRVAVYLLMTQKSKQYNNDEFVQKYGEEFLSIVQNASDEERKMPGADAVKMAIYLVTRILYHDAFMDSLRAGNEAYAQMQRFVMGKILEVDPSSVTNIIAGTAAQEVKGEFVYPEAARNDRFPRSGKISLLLMVSNRSQGSRENFVRNAILHRIKRTFPEIDIVLLAGTSGTIAPLAPLAPSDEAAITNKMFREYQGIPATLLVSTTPFSRVPNLDRRVIKLPNPLAQSLSFQNVDDGFAFLIDSSGQFVESVFLYEGTEQLLNEVIRVLLERDGGKE